MDILAYSKINNLLKNKGVGFTEKTSRKLLLDEQFEGETLGTEGMCMITLPSLLEISEGDNLTVNWNGKQYICKSIPFTNEGATLCLFGNLALVGAGADTGEPFLYSPAESEGGITGAFMTTENATENGTVTVSVTAETETIHTIDPKYLPSGGGGGLPVVVLSSFETLTDDEQAQLDTCALQKTPIILKIETDDADATMVFGFKRVGGTCVYLNNELGYLQRDADGWTINFS